MKADHSIISLFHLFPPFAGKIVSRTVDVQDILGDAHLMLDKEDEEGMWRLGIFRDVFKTFYYRLWFKFGKRRNIWCGFQIDVTTSITKIQELSWVCYWFEIPQPRLCIF